MSVLAAVILAVVVAPSVLLIASALLASVARARRRRRARRLRPLSDREVANALAPFGADISIWPARAPRNGSTYDPVE